MKIISSIFNFIAWSGVIVLSTIVVTVASIGYGLSKLFPFILFCGMVIFPIVYSVIYFEGLMDREIWSIVVIALMPIYIYITSRKGREARVV